MTRFRDLAPLVIAVSTLAAVPLSGCAGTGTATLVVREESPPPSRVERVEYRPGYVFIQGHWTRYAGRQWAWQPGHYERERPGYVYIEGRWRSDRGGHVWVDGEWRQRGGVVIRDRR